MQISRHLSKFLKLRLALYKQPLEEGGGNEWRKFLVLFAPPWFVYLHDYVISKPILNEILVDLNRVHDVFLSRDPPFFFRRYLLESNTPSSTPFIVGYM